MTNPPPQKSPRRDNGSSDLPPPKTQDRLIPQMSLKGWSPDANLQQLIRSVTKVPGEPQPGGK